MVTHKAKASLAAALLTLAALPAQAQDWTGAYIGAGASSHSGTNTDFFNGALATGFQNPDNRSGSMKSIHAGYRYQVENVVYGVELSRASGRLEMETVPGNHISGTTTALAKIGYATDNILLSMGVGYFEGKLVPNCVASCGTADISGLALSIGADYAFESGMTVGAAIIRRENRKGAYSLLSGDHVNKGTDTALELRVGYNF
ncbi:MAG: outer membrane beta-barrel protein [Sulfitobacter sp.]|nr:outer membrane beta-barrel protein [Sulfitobacter sp.]